MSCTPATPGLLLGGQLHNSTSSDLARAREVFDRVVALGGNAVTATVSWHLVEPEEGVYDFSGVDPLVDMARERGLALTLLWFGAYKNAASTYAPRWVRADASRFPRAELGAASAGPSAFSRPGTPVLSVFSAELRAADRRAFEALTAHLASTGAAQADGGPLVMLQVENETGLLGAGRDHSAVANAAWAAQVPTTLTDWLAAHPDARGTAARLWREHGSRSAGTWAELFGQDAWAEETFMAAGFAAYCGELAAAGAERLDVTYYANAWLGPQPGQDLPGQYPSGGPVGGQVDVWRALAPALAFLGPDVYVDDVKTALAPYVRGDNALVVPESRLAVGNLFWALGSGAVAFSVFGVDDVRTDGQLAAAYRLLGGAGEVIRAAQREGRVRPVLLESGESAVVELGGLRWTLRGSMDVLKAMFLDAGVAVRTEAAEAPSESVGDALVTSPADTRATAVLVDLGGDELLAIGQGLMFEVEGADGSLVEIDDAWEGAYVDGAWVAGRNLNGDERLNLLPPDSLGAVRLRVLRRG
ncbi:MULTISPECIES: DUF5597 domain-containing protein [Actinomyces]|uniref:DUF5597 domain-containing protein n=1 Tax=Actinomyces respiraculi TaxID=2744574 RepID=A0A7T0PW12_9ACTO|nr:MULTISPECIES: DUF5597 domain-containing protein [Actinomyces]QPL05259.1 DUF5597 domain-containing protein [Actinomyces respiraculi]